MKKTWQFVKENNLPKEAAAGRDHFWHFSHDFKGNTDTMLVKVVVPENGGHDFHRHPKMDEVLYVLKGTAEQWVEGEMQQMKVGDSVYIDADVVHATFNTGEETLELLAILSPKEGWEAGTIDESGNEPYVSYRNK
ncbi:MAG: cupin domain-containing protein [Bacteroidota bacterium]